MPQDLSGATESPRYTFLLISLSLKEPHGLINIQDVDVGTDIDCGELLLKRPGFIRSGDGRLAYDYRGTKVYVEAQATAHGTSQIPGQQMSTM